MIENIENGNIEDRVESYKQERAVNKNTDSSFIKKMIEFYSILHEDEGFSGNSEVVKSAVRYYNSLLKKKVTNLKISSIASVYGVDIQVQDAMNSAKRMITNYAKFSKYIVTESNKTGKLRIINGFTVPNELKNDPKFAFNMTFEHPELFTEVVSAKLRKNKRFMQSILMASKKIYADTGVDIVGDNYNAFLNVLGNDEISLLVHLLNTSEIRMPDGNDIHIRELADIHFD